MCKYKIPEVDGKYLGYFDTREEASQHIDDLIRTYRHHPNPSKISVRSLLKEQREKYGIKINQGSFYRWLSENNITVRNTRPSDKIPKQQRNYTISKEVDEALQPFDNKSELVELGLRVILGLECDDVIVFFEDGIRVMFTHDTGRIKAITNSKLNERDKRIIRSWVEGANIHGIQYVVNECKRIGFHYYGGNNYE